MVWKDRTDAWQAGVVGKSSRFVRLFDPRVVDAFALVT